MNANAEAIVAKLDELAEIKAAAEATRSDYEAKRAEILKVIQAELEALDAEYQPLLESVGQRILALEADIKHDVLLHGASVKSRRWHAVFSKGRVTWDTKGLDEYAATHPEVVSFRKEGEASISLRVAKQADKAKTDLGQREGPV